MLKNNKGQELVMERGVFVWSVKHFRRFLDMPGSQIESPIFTVSPNSTYLWKLTMINSVNLITINLVSCSKEEVKAIVKIAFIQKSGNVHWQQTTRKPLKGEDHISLSFEHSDPLDTTKKVLFPDDVLQVSCELKFLRKSSASAPVNNAPSRPNLEEDALSVVKRNYRILYDQLPTDVKVVVGDVVFDVHKCILRAASPFFDKMFEHDMTEKLNNTVRLDDVDPNVMKSLINFVYHGEIGGEFSPALATDLYSAAAMYQVEDLVKVCLDYMKNNLTDANACDMLVFANLHSDEELKTAATNYVRARAPRIFQTSEWKAFSSTYPVPALDILHCYFDDRALNDN